MIMLIVTVLNLFNTRSLNFPVWFWLPWSLYIIIYLIMDFSLLGLQLTFQYTLPILIGIVASGLSCKEEDLHWLFRWFMILTGLIYAFFLYANVFGSGYTPGMSTMPMLFSISISLLAALFFITRREKYIFYLILLFIAPVVELTRTGIIATAAVFILHFANESLKNKILFGALGVSAFLIVFHSQPFQEKTFYSGQGTLSDMTSNYYDNPDIRSSGRISWKNALEPGLKAEPVWGNGPRADYAYLTKITKNRGGEAHNDYLSVRFNYGYVGLALLMFGFIASFISLFILSKRYKDNWYLWLISTSSLTLFFAFLMFMYTDNILKYTIYFPNYFFAIIGIVYSLRRDEDLSSDTALQ